MSFRGERRSRDEDCLENIVLKEVSARLATFLVQLVESGSVMRPEGYKVPTRYTHRQLATMIGSSRETARKAFKPLQQAGVVEQKRRRIHVKDLVDTLQEVGEPRDAPDTGRMGLP